MRRLILPTIVVFLLSAAAAWATTYQNGTTGQQSPGTVIECGTPGVPCGNVTTPVVTTQQGGSGADAVPTTNGSTTITTGGTFQTILVASTARKSFEFQNICNKSGNCTTTANLCYLYIAASGSGTTANSIVVQPGQAYLRSAGNIPSDAISATCDGNSDKFYLGSQ